MRGRLGVAVLLLAVTTSLAHAARSVTIYLDRDGDVTDTGVRIPRFGGGDRAWTSVVACVRRQYAPFAVDVVDQRPAGGDYITAVIGGRASLLGLDDRTTNGVGPYDGAVIPNAMVHIFSQVGTGERDIENLCAVTAHEVGHALGLDHEVYCGDIMSYYLDRCGARRFIDADAPCGEGAERACGSGDESQNSYRRLGELVGFRDADDGNAAEPSVAQPRRRPQPRPQPQPADDSDDEPARAGWVRDDGAPQDPYVDDPWSAQAPPADTTRDADGGASRATGAPHQCNHVYTTSRRVVVVRPQRAAPHRTVVVRRYHFQSR